MKLFLVSFHSLVKLDELSRRKCNLQRAAIDSSSRIKVVIYIFKVYFESTFDF